MKLSIFVLLKTNYHAIKNWIPSTLPDDYSAGQTKQIYQYE